MTHSGRRQLQFVVFNAELSNMMFILHTYAVWCPCARFYKLFQRPCDKSKKDAIFMLLFTLSLAPNGFPWKRATEKLSIGFDVENMYHTYSTGYRKFSSTSPSHTKDWRIILLDGGKCWCNVDIRITSEPWASCQIREMAGCACAGNAGNVFPAINFKGNR